MSDGTPMFTLVKSQEFGAIPSGLDEKSKQLVNTLGMLCSFLSAADLASFLHSEMFSSSFRQGDAWIGLELGLYEDHTKTLEVVPNKHELLIVDNHATGALEENIFRCEEESETAKTLMDWFSIVYSKNARFN
ncbi:MAG: hypothetical protein CMA72_08760 [Euryarchaeota archaeon]|jgi:hypothetical protein|nr:hypothetical protein [Euryarchaeota archaeon]|tara:strand:+ start:853 stop:1251 length:399 start_codon:yes stop_codon:yes gene_type:complete